MRKVSFEQTTPLAGKTYIKGVHQVPEKDLHLNEFKALVKAGKARLVERSEAEQTLQAHHDEFNALDAHHKALANHSRDERVLSAEAQHVKEEES